MFDTGLMVVLILVLAFNCFVLICGIGLIDKIDKRLVEEQRRNGNR